MVGKIKTWIRRVLAFILGAAVIFASWFLVFVHPNPSRVPDPLAALDGARGFEGNRFRAARDLIFDLDSAWTRVPNLKKGRGELSGVDFFAEYPFPGLEKNKDLAVSMTQGKHAMFLEQRNALYMPAPAEIFFNVSVPEGGVLRFGTSMLGRIDGRELAPVTFTVYITDEKGESRVKVFGQTRSPEPVFPWSEEDFWYHTFLKFIRIDHGFYNGRWYDHEVKLEKYAGKEIGILFKAETADSSLSHGFISTPRIYAPDSEDRPNVIVAVMDTMRADFVGANNPEAAGLSPNIDRLASEGATFTNVRSQGNWSRGSFASIFTGVPVPELGFAARWSFDREEKRIYNQRRHPSAPERFRRNGYTTVSVGNNPFVYDGSPVGLHLGFDQAVDIQREPYDTEFSTAEAIRWLGGHAGERFFMMFTLNTAHSPFRPPLKYILRGLKPSMNIQESLYRGVIAYADDYMGKLLEALDRTGLSKNTIVVVIADHGVILFRDGQIRARPGGRYDQILATHTHTLYEEETRVPLVIRYPGKIHPGQRHDDMAALLDLAPTLAGLSGVEPDSRWTGRDFSGLLEGSGGVEGKPRVITAEGENVWSMVTPDGYKYIRRGVAMARMKTPGGGDVRSIKEEVFDLNKDPHEKNDLSQNAPELVEKLRGLFAAEYPSHVRIYKALVRKGGGPGDLSFRIKTGGRFVFFDSPSPGKDEGPAVKLAPDDGKEKVVMVEGEAGSAVFFFEVSPPDAPVSFEALGPDGSGMAPGYIRLTPLCVRGDVNPVVLKADRDSFYLSDPDMLINEAASDEGVYLVTIPFSRWKSHSTARIRLDRELETMMKKWGYM